MASRLIISFVAFIISGALLAQTDSKIWESVPNIDLEKMEFDRRIVPQKYLTFQADLDKLKSIMLTAPSSSDKSKTGTTLEIPFPDGSFKKFKIFQANLMPQKLQNKFPAIRHFTGYGIDDPTATIKLDFTPKGFHAFVLSSLDHSVFIDPYSRGNIDYYTVYFAKDFEGKSKEFRCGFVPPKSQGKVDSQSDEKAGDCKLREYRLALACTGEYAIYHDDGDNGNGDITDDAMAAMTTTMNRVNGVFERDAGVTMVLVPNNDTLIFTDGGTDPYTNSDGGAMLGQNQTTCDNRIGSANYDIGHVFSTGGGGVAYLRAPCNNSIKAGGVTGQGSPEGDPFDIDYVSHEMGHQYGANHTQNNSCNRNNSTAYEPGSASTIMGYAGICSPNVQNNSDDYFHGISLQEMGNFTSGTGNSCATVLDDTNTKPSVDPVGDYTIPISTPFILTGTATDAEGDPMTYCWEQWDNEVATMPPVSTSTTGPAFRSFDPSTSPSRSFPRETVVAGSGTATWEVLPSVTRNMDFRLNVRDNHPAYGCTEHISMRVSTTTSAGPFLVTYPNAAENWDANATETITWDVASTDGGSVNCSQVNILLSTDGGLTFPTTLVSNVANDGSQDITVPDIESALVRIKVECSDNIFYDISDENISVGLTVLCDTIFSTDVPKSISPSGTSSISSTLDVYFDGDVNDIDVIDLEGSHTWVGDLEISIEDPSSTNVMLIDNQCGSDDDFNLNLDDSGGSLPCPFTDGNSYAPNQPLSNFNSFDPRGTWTLKIDDTADGDGGTLDNWGLSVCYIKGECVASMQVPTDVGVYTGNFECEDDNGWTHYMHITAMDDTLILLSVEKGNSGVELDASQVKVEVLSGSGAIDLSTAPYVSNPNGWYVMRRYWDVIPTTQPTGNINIRSYYSTMDYTDIATEDNGVQAHEDLSHYKITGTDDPNPSTGHTGVMPNEYSEPGFVYVPYGSDHRVQYAISSFSGGGGGGSSANGGPVPVELLKFEAEADNGNILLNWSTTNEINNYGFEILRTTDPIKDAEVVGFVPAISIQQSTYDYAFIDENIKRGIPYYYKLKQVDHDGNFSFSDWRSAMVTHSDLSIQVIPNPTKGSSRLLLSDPLEDNAELILYDVNGIILFSKTYERGTSLIELELHSLPIGNYFVRIHSESVNEILRVTKM